jgi:uncharacterized protein (TIGR03435 family)
MVLILFSLLVFQPSFEVASVKPSPPQEREIGGFYTYPGGRITAKGATLDYLIQQAFDVQGFQISGGPDWIHHDRFNIDARPPASSRSSKTNPSSPKTPPNEEQRQMLQALLIDRFGLKYRRDDLQGPVYFLVRTNKKLRLEEANDKDAFPWAGGPAGGMIMGDGIAGTNITMPQFATRLSRYLERPVQDRTGLEGPYDFKFSYKADDPEPDVASSILMSVQELGLKLESGKGPVATIVIEHVEKLAAN